MISERILEKVGWLTKIETIYIPPKTQEEIERLKSQYNKYIHDMFRVGIMFLQGKGLTTRTVLRDNDVVNDELQLTVGDLTEDGLRFYGTGITKWRQKLDRSVNRTKIVTDTSFLEKKYHEYMGYELPLFKKLLSEVNGDNKILENKKKLTPIIENIISGLDGDMRDFFTKRSRKTTVDMMYVFCFQYVHFR